MKAPGTVSIIIRPPGRAPYALPLDRLTQHVRAARTLHHMGRLSKHFDRANAAMDRVETETAKDVDKLVERTEHYHKRRAQVFQSKHEGLDAQIGELAEFERDQEDFAKNDHGDAGERTDVTKPGDDTADALTVLIAPAVGIDLAKPGEDRTASWVPKPDRSFKH